MPSPKRELCPCCDKADRLEYNVLTDEYTCYACGLVSTTNEVRTHYNEMKGKNEKPETAPRQSDDPEVAGGGDH